MASSESGIWGWARSVAEGQIRHRAEAHYPGSQATARIRSERFLWPLVSRGSVSDIDVALFDLAVDAGPVALRLRRLLIELHEVTVGRRDLWRGRIRLKSLGTGRIEAEIDGPSLATALGLPLVFHDDEVEVRPGVGPFVVSARGALSVEDNVIKFRPGRVQGVPLLVSMDFEVSIPTSPLWPRAVDACSVEGGLVLTCGLDEIPPGLIGPSSRRALA